jgi:hypothetical protein
MTSQLIASYPLIAASTKTDEENTGVIEGEHGSDETTKKIWTTAEERRIEDNVHNRELAFEIDPLVKFIVNIKRFSILKNYIITSNDDTTHEALITTITTFIDDIKLMSRFRQSFTPLQIHGSAHLQKLTKGKSLSNLSLILNLEKYTNPLNASKYYYYQNLEVSKDWLNPEESNTQTQKVWYIDLKDEEKFTAIDKVTTLDKVGDKVFARDLIIEILNNDAGESDIRPIISQIFIKNFLIAHLPNLITIVTSPDEELIYKARDAAGNFMVPQMIVGSSQSLNSAMIDVLVRVLDTQIAYGMGFSLSLINASGVELSTSRNVYSTIAVTLRGIQEQYEHVAQDIINDQFSEAVKAGITFSLGELNPADENEVAKTKKIYAEIIDILWNMGLSSEQTNNFMSKYIDRTLEMETADISEEATEAATEAIGAMEDYVDLVNEEDSRVVIDK